MQLSAVARLLFLWSCCFVVPFDGKAACPLKMTTAENLAAVEGFVRAIPPRFLNFKNGGDCPKPFAESAQRRPEGNRDRVRPGAATRPIGGKAGKQINHGRIRVAGRVAIKYSAIGE
jgi:hypothetical protein